jgi:aldehyde:ferredoxin oxidoreductase
MVMTKSPLTGAITCSNSGGVFPTELKRTGYDAIIFSGRSEKPVYLWIDQEKAELRTAVHLWGKDAPETPTCSLPRPMLRPEWPALVRQVKKRS